MNLYCDRKNACVVDREPSVEEQLSGKELMTSLGKACEKQEIEIITAYSAQAKGRIERCRIVFQGRFVKELRLQGINSFKEVNKVLASGFVKDLKRWFTIHPLAPHDAHVKIQKRVDLRTIFRFEEIWTVSNDWVVQYTT
jgi:hypothetical protein